MSYSLDNIKSFKTINLDNFEIRGSKTGVNNAVSTGPLFDGGQYIPAKTVFTGVCDTTSGDTTVRNILFNSPFDDLNATSLKIGDTLITEFNNFIISSLVDSSTVVLNSTPNSTISRSDTTFSLIGRDYLIEPDISYNTNQGIAVFTQDSSVVTGIGTSWLTDLAIGDSIQRDAYQKYFLIVRVIDNATIHLSTVFDGPTATDTYTAKKWRLGRLAYQYVKNNFSYNKLKALWTYDSTSGNGQIATSDWTNFINGIQLKFSQTLDASAYPDLMDSNVANNLVLNQSTQYDSYEFALPVVPNPEESFQLYINDSTKDMFPNGNCDYVINYSQLPTYQTPPAPDQRTVANLMFLKPVKDATLANNGSGILTFVDTTGNAVSGIMPGTETIIVDGTAQVRNKDYVIDTDAGLGYLSEAKTDEPIVKYIMAQKFRLYDLGLNISLDGTPQTVTIPHADTDDVLFDTESGRLKPVNSDNPGPGEEYLVEYFVEGDYIDSETVSVIAPTMWIRTQKYPIKFQSLIISKNGTILDEGTDYRVSYLTGRVVFFSSLAVDDLLEYSYSPLIKYKNGISYADGNWYCSVYDSTSPVATAAPISFNLANTSLVDATGFIVQSIYNATKSQTYNINGYIKTGLNIAVVNDSTNMPINTSLTDTILINYKFINPGVEFIPVETINFIALQDTNYLAFIDQNLTGTFLPNYLIRLTNVDSAGDFYFRDASAIYDGEDTVIYLQGNIPQDIINPYIYLTDSSISFSLINPPVPITINGTIQCLGSSDVCSAYGQTIVNYILDTTALNGGVNKLPDLPYYASGTEVMLSASAGTGYHFTSWGGDLTGSTNPSIIIMDDNKNVTANFAINTYILNITAVNGSVSKVPDQINYNFGTMVTLDATPAENYQFHNWSGSITSSTNPITITMNGNKNVIANFTLLPVPIAYWPGINNSHDVIGGLDATWYGTPSYGLDGTGFSLDGASYLQVEDPLDIFNFNPYDSIVGFTVTFSILTPADFPKLSGFEALVLKMNGEGNDWGWGIWTDQGELFCKKTGGNFYTIGANLQPNTKYDITYRYRNAVVCEIWINGIRQTLQPDISGWISWDNPGLGNPLRFGIYRPYSLDSWEFKGIISNIKIYNTIVPV